MKIDITVAQNCTTRLFSLVRHEKNTNVMWHWLQTDVFNLIAHVTDNSYQLTHYYFYFLLDEAQKKLEEYATKDSKAANNKKITETNGNQNKANVGKNSKRSNLKKRSDKTNYSHDWLITTLKGHTGSVMDMSFSANGKYLATCADGEFYRQFNCLVNSRINHNSAKWLTPLLSRLNY